jgi:hypothetical protein
MSAIGGTLQSRRTRLRASWREARGHPATPAASASAKPTTEAHVQQLPSRSEAQARRSIQPAPPPKAVQSKSGPLGLTINLERRSDRLQAMRQLPIGVPWERLDAVDGRKLTWADAAAQGVLHKDALRDGQWAEREAMPTICRRTGSFSPHLTLGAVGVALSHRKAWQMLVDSERE